MNNYQAVMIAVVALQMYLWFIVCLIQFLVDYGWRKPNEHN